MVLKRALGRAGGVDGAHTVVVKKSSRTVSAAIPLNHR